MQPICDHRQTPPRTYAEPADACVLVGDTSIPPGCEALPDGIYRAGPDDPVPAGYRATAWTRVVRDGLSVNAPTLEPIPLAEVQASRTAAVMAECDARLESRWPIADRLAATLGIPMDPDPDVAGDVAAHLAARDAAVAAIAAATDAAGVAAVVPDWPEARDPAEARPAMNTVAWAGKLKG
jgi:hypothetical protein